MAKNIVLKDDISLRKDSIGSYKPTLYAKTRIMGGYGLYRDEFGVSQLHESVFDTHNMVPIGGVQYAMEQIFGVRGPLSVPYLNDSHQIGAQNSTIVPSGNMPYPYGHAVCLFGVGTGGAAENNSTVLEVKYNETEIANMVPFRYTNIKLSDTDSKKYYGIKSVDGTLAYYLKRFDQDPEIKHLWKNGEDGEDGTEVTDSVFTSASKEGIESFTEMILTISKKDIREWFNVNGNIEAPRINSIALFSGVYDSTQKDYAMIKLMSKLNIPTESLTLSKDLNIIYRVYGS